WLEDVRRRLIQADHARRTSAEANDLIQWIDVAEKLVGDTHVEHRYRIAAIDLGISEPASRRELPTLNFRVARVRSKDPRCLRSRSTILSATVNLSPHRRVSNFGQ